MYIMAILTELSRLLVSIFGAGMYMAFEKIAGNDKN